MANSPPDAAPSAAPEMTTREFKRSLETNPDYDPNIVIETQNLTKIYRDFWGRPKVRALKALDLDVRRGEVFGLLGPNGSGKSTTIKLLLGLLFPTSGRALVFGKDAVEVTKNERIGYLPEESYLYRFLTAEETLDFYGRLFDMPAAVRRERTAALIEKVGLSWAKRRQLKEYSKGMARRIGLAQALINDPDLILLDEPTSGLDPLGTREMKDMILELRGQGKTVVMSSHLLADVQDVCDRIAILYKGDLKELGRVDHLLQVSDVTQIRAQGLSPDVIAELLRGSGSASNPRLPGRSSADDPRTVVLEHHPRERGTAGAPLGRDRPPASRRNGDSLVGREVLWSSPNSTRFIPGSPGGRTSSPVRWSRLDSSRAAA